MTFWRFCTPVFIHVLYMLPFSSDREREREKVVTELYPYLHLHIIHIYKCNLLCVNAWTGFLFNILKVLVVSLYRDHSVVRVHLGACLVLCHPGIGLSASASRFKSSIQLHQMTLKVPSTSPVVGGVLLFIYWGRMLYFLYTALWCIPKNGLKAF